MTDSAIQDKIDQEYAYGFHTDIESITAPKGLNKEVIEFISKQKKEPQWLLNWRLKAYDRLQLMTEPSWPKTSISQNRLSGFVLLFSTQKF